MVDLPALSVTVQGLHAWNELECDRIDEPRLLSALQQEFGLQITSLRALPFEEERETWELPDSSKGVPVEPFPEWLVCPLCRNLLPLESGLLELKADPFRPDKTYYLHRNCPQQTRRPALPVRFMRACPKGHLDDLPWVEFVHKGETNCAARLRLDQYGVTGEASQITVSCLTCDRRRSLAEAFGDRADELIGKCSGRHPHLGLTSDEPCEAPTRAVSLGAANTWFPAIRSVLTIPGEGGELDEIVERHWESLQKVETLEKLQIVHDFLHDQLKSWSPDQLWVAMERRHLATDTGTGAKEELRPPEWRILIETPIPSGTEFSARETPVPHWHASWLERAALIDRLRLVEALVGFSRLESAGAEDGSEDEEIELAPLTRGNLTWVPASEARGEGIFLRIRESAIQGWLKAPAVMRIGSEFSAAHAAECARRGVSLESRPFPGMRYVLLHSVAHLLMRQIALDSGYATASIRERIYSAEPTDDDGPMAGILLMTSSSDSEGTLGGLVRLGEHDRLGDLIDAALCEAEDCASDPYCAEHGPSRDDGSVHGAACHACIFVPETSCERGNRYLDRNVLVETFAMRNVAFY